MLTHPQHRVLEALGRFHYLTAAQVCRLYYSPNTLSDVYRLLKSLREQGYTQELFLDRKTRYGRAQTVIRLARKGLTYLASIGVDTEHRYRPSEQDTLTTFHLRHTLSVNDFLIAAELLTRDNPNIQIPHIIHEKDFSSFLSGRAPRVAANLQHTQTAFVVPDAWLDIRLVYSPTERYRVPIVLEVDRGTEEQRVFRAKIHALIIWAKTVYPKLFQSQFGTSDLTIAVVAVTGQKRCDDLLAWTATEIELMKERHESDLFRFTSVSLVETASLDLFFGVHWRAPFTPQLTSLFSINRK